MTTYIIAEAGVNHNGSMDMAKKLIDVAKDAGADAVKFQTFTAKQLLTTTVSKANYQLKTTDQSESQMEMIQKLELDEKSHAELIDYANNKKIQFLSTPFDCQSVKLLTHHFDLPKIKIASGEITNSPLILEIAKTKKPIILSTGMSTLSDIETALGVIAFGYLYSDKLNPSLEHFAKAYCEPAAQNILRENVVLLHCTTEYPAPYAEINLRVMDTLSQAFGLSVGYSDHSQGIEIAIAAVARGASIIEKHFTLDRNLPGPDHQASLLPDELTQMVKSIRNVEQALGSPIKIPTKSELCNRAIARKQLVALAKINSGEIFTEKNLGTKRSADGISANLYWEKLGKVATQNYCENDVVLD